MPFDAWGNHLLTFEITPPFLYCRSEMNFPIARGRKASHVTVTRINKHNNGALLTDTGIVTCILLPLGEGVRRYLLPTQ